MSRARKLGLILGVGAWLVVSSLAVPYRSPMVAGAVLIADVALLAVVAVWKEV